MSRQKKEGMHCVAIGEGLSVEVAFQLRTEGHRRARHVKRKGKGVQATWEPRQRGQAVPWHMQVDRATTCQSCPPPTLSPSSSGFALQTNNLTLGLMIAGWSREDRQHRSPGLCGTFQVMEGLYQMGRLGAGGTQSSPAQPAASRGAEPGEF